eukprot:scaffold824_cov327-Pavlova_lutheri.AAC.24
MPADTCTVGTVGPVHLHAAALGARSEALERVAGRRKDRSWTWSRRRRSWHASTAHGEGTPALCRRHLGLETVPRRKSVAEVRRRLQRSQAKARQLPPRREGNQKRIESGESEERSRGPPREDPGTRRGTSGTSREVSCTSHRSIAETQARTTGIRRSNRCLSHEGWRKEAKTKTGLSERTSAASCSWESQAAWLPSN